MCTKLEQGWGMSFFAKQCSLLPFFNTESRHISIIIIIIIIIIAIRCEKQNFSLRGAGCWIIFFSSLPFAPPQLEEGYSHRESQHTIEGTFSKSFSLAHHFSAAWQNVFFFWPPQRSPFLSYDRQFSAILFFFFLHDSTFPSFLFPSLCKKAISSRRLPHAPENVNRTGKEKNGKNKKREYALLARCCLHPSASLWVAEASTSRRTCLGRFRSVSNHPLNSPEEKIFL